jgi:hypothetical protein
MSQSHMAANFSEDGSGFSPNDDNHLLEYTV